MVANVDYIVSPSKTIRLYLYNTLCVCVVLGYCNTDEAVLFKERDRPDGVSLLLLYLYLLLLEDFLAFVGDNTT
jgi:hypothetical protein